MITISTDSLELGLSLLIIVGLLVLSFVSGFVWGDMRKTGNGRRA